MQPVGLTPCLLPCPSRYDMHAEMDMDEEDVAGEGGAAMPAGVASLTHQWQHFASRRIKQDCVRHRPPSACGLERHLLTLLPLPALQALTELGHFFGDFPHFIQANGLLGLRGLYGKAVQVVLCLSCAAHASAQGLCRCPLCRLQVELSTPSEEALGALQARVGSQLGRLARCAGPVGESPLRAEACMRAFDAPATKQDEAGSSAAARGGRPLLPLLRGSRREGGEAGVVSACTGGCVPRALCSCWCL